MIKRATSVCCPHSHLATRQPNDARLDSFEQFTQPVVEPVVQAAVKCKHRVTYAGMARGNDGSHLPPARL